MSFLSIFSSWGSVLGPRFVLGYLSFRESIDLNVRGGVSTHMETAILVISELGAVRYKVDYAILFVSALPVCVRRPHAKCFVLQIFVV